MKIVKYFALLSNFILLIWNTECASILGLFVWPTRSHFTIGSVLMKELAGRGHDVTMVTTYAEDTKLKNYRIIVLDNLSKWAEKLALSERLFDLGRKSSFYKFMKAAHGGEAVVKQTLKHPAFQKLLNTNESFDVVLLDIICTEALIGLGHRFRCPVIGVDTHGVPFFTNHLVGNSAPFAYSPQVYSPYPPEMNMFQRFSNTIYGIISEFFKTYVHMRQQEALLKQYLKDTSSLEEVIYNSLSMILLNSHPGISGVTVSVPAIAHIGGFHVQEPKPLPKEFQDFLDDAENGVILFSLGTILSSAQIPTEKRNAILKSIAKFNLKVLWKFEKENMPDVSDNIKIVNWLPQNDILAHPNIKGFITHGGILSITESIYNGVPIIGIPGFADQHMNIETAVQKGYGLKVEIEELTEETFTSVLDKIIKDPRYLDCARKHSRIFHDQDMKPMDKAVFWTEYVIRHQGVQHLRSPCMNLHWTQIYMLDIISVLIFSSVAVLLVLWTLVKHLTAIKVETNIKNNAE